MGVFAHYLGTEHEGNGISQFVLCLDAYVHYPVKVWLLYIHYAPTCEALPQQHTKGRRVYWVFLFDIRELHSAMLRRCADEQPEVFAAAAQVDCKLVLFGLLYLVYPAANYAPALCHGCGEIKSVHCHSKISYLL